MNFKNLLLITAIAVPTSMVVATTAQADTSFAAAPYIQDMDDAKKHKKMKMKKEHGMEMSAEMKAKFAKCYELEGDAKAACKAPLMEERKAMQKMKMKKTMKNEHGMEMSAEMKAKFAKCYELEGDAKAACKAPLMKERKEMHEKKMMEHKSEMKEHHKEMKEHHKEMKDHKKEMKKDSDN